MLLKRIFLQKGWAASGLYGGQGGAGGGRGGAGRGRGRTGGQAGRRRGPRYRLELM